MTMTVFLLYVWDCVGLHNNKQGTGLLVAHTSTAQGHQALGVGHAGGEVSQRLRLVCCPALLCLGSHVGSC
jgi:hypothetical protein